MKKIGIAAAFLATLLLFSACGKEETGIIKTGTELPENGETAIVSAEGSVFAANYFFEAPQTAEDCSGKLNEILTEAAKTGGTVYLKGGTYRISEPIVLPDNVSLQGDYSAPNTKTEAQTETVITVLATKNNKNSPTITLGNNSTLSGIKIWYDGRNYSETEEFGYAVSAARSENVVIENVTIPNCCKGVELSATKDAVVRNVSVTAFSTGISVDSATGGVFLSDVSVSPVYLLNDKRYSPLTEDLSALLTENTVGIYIGNVEAISLFNCSVDTAKTGIDVNMPETGEGLFSATECSTVNCQTSVCVEEAGKNGLTLTNCDFSSNGLSGSVGVYFSEKYKTEAALCNCKFTGFPDVAVKSEGSGLTSVTNCNFIGWHMRAFESSDETLAVLFSYFGISKSLGSLENYGVGMFIDCTFQEETLIEGGNYVQNDEKSGYSMPSPDLSSVYTSDPYSPKNKKYVKASDFGLSEVLDDAGPAIQQAIGSALENGAGAVLIDAGTYMVRTPITLPDGIYLIGAGSNANSEFSTRLIYNGSASLITIGKDCGVSGMILEGKSSSPVIYAKDVSGVKITDIHLDDVADGICLSNVKNARIEDVSGSSDSNGIRLENCDNVFTGYCKLVSNGKTGISVSSGNAVSVQNLTRGQEVGFKAENSAKTVSIGCIFDKNKTSIENSDVKNAVIVSALSAPDNGTHLSAVKGTSEIYGLVTGGTVTTAATVKGGECGIYSSIFKQSGSNAVTVSGGKVSVTGNVFPDIPTGNHFIQTGGSSAAVGNIVRSNTVFAAISAKYMKTDISGGSFEEKFSIKGYDVNEGDNDEESDSE